MRVYKYVAASSRDNGQHRPAPGLQRARTCHRLRMLLILVFDATIFSRRSPDLQSSFSLGSLFLPKSGLIELSHPSSSCIILCIVRPVRERAEGPHIPCELLQVSVEVVLIKERLVVVVERLEEVDILFIFDERCGEFCFLRCDLRSWMVNERLCMPSR